ncbi:MAG TPA: hypothetical protein VGG89_07655 [Candidatus Baltobacteraceae bacterium]|jgi:hypothetical protein
MAYIVCLIVGYIIGAYLMRRHMLNSIRAAARREVARAMTEYERGLLRTIRAAPACRELRD